MIRRFSMAVLLSVLSLSAWTKEASALVVVTGHGGSALTVLSKGSGQTPMNGIGYCYGGTLMWQPGNGKSLSIFALGLAAKQISSRYTENNIEKNGTYTLFGPQIGLTAVMSESISLQGLVLYSPASSLTTISSHSIAVNGESFHYSTWENYKGRGAIEGRLTLVHDKVSGQFSKQNRFRSGIGLSYSVQSFTDSTTKISTSREALTPSETSSSDRVSYSFVTVTLDLFLGISF
ncbi:MAG: hypothetical protein EOP10_10050 [Proteobacteria bacterium]|nr:MAG: hypothetical protein EOP10_10050 [Pseudomonadota bacterium]